MRFVVLVLAGCAMPGAAWAQNHSDHSKHQQEAPTEEQQAEPVDHSQMDHSQHEPSLPKLPPLRLPPPESAAPIPSGPPPAAAFSGPLHAADAIVGEEKMAAAREDLAKEMGGAGSFFVMAERLEYRARGGEDGYLWDVHGYAGGDLSKFRFKTEGEGAFGGEIEQAEAQALYSRAITPFFDLQVGVRQDFAGPSRTHAVLGVYGLAPYLFEIDVSAFLSDEGELTARIEAELDQRITQRLILQPRAEIALSAQDIPELGVGAGLDSFELGARLRYEIAREFAPYVGLEQEWKLGGSADYVRAAGEDASSTNFIVGVRLWF